MFHIALHFIVPLLVAGIVFRRHFGRAALFMLATMAVDVDHLLATPIYDAARCSIGFHPLHSLPAIVAYALIMLLPLWLGRRRDALGFRPGALALHWIGLGLLIHMALDWSDCGFQLP